MKNTKRIDYRGTQFGPLTLIQPSTVKREWIARCPKGHETSVRPDILKRTLPSLIHCDACSTAKFTPASAPKTAPPSLTPDQVEALRLLDRSLALTIKALQTVTALLSPAA